MQFAQRGVLSLEFFVLCSKGRIAVCPSIQDGLPQPDGPNQQRAQGYHQQGHRGESQHPLPPHCAPPGGLPGLCLVELSLPQHPQHGLGPPVARLEAQELF